MRLDWSEHKGLAYRGARRWARGRPELLADAEQEHLLTLWLAAESDRYDPARGRASTFLVSSLRAAWRPCRRTAGVIRGVRHVESLDEPLGDGDATLHDVIGDGRPGPELELLEVDARIQLRARVEELPESERETIVRRFGLDGRGLRTLAEVASELGCSPEAARQAERRALERLRSRYVKTANAHRKAGSPTS